MAASFREWPWPLQALLYVVGAFALVLAGLYVPGSPVASVRGQLESAQAELKPLDAEVANLRVYKQRRAELQSQMDALQKQLATLQTIVPEDKQADQFILMVQREARGSGVSIRSLTTQPVASRTYYYEMPFSLQVDAPYFSLLDFYGRLGRLSRIINIGDVKLGPAPATSTFHMTPGTSVTSTFTITTFFTKDSTQKAGGSAPAKR